MPVNENPTALPSGPLSSVLTALNSAGTDFYGNAWTENSVQSTYSGTDNDQKKRLLYLLLLLAAA
jgi:hypothetical protein